MNELPFYPRNPAAVAAERPHLSRDQYGGYDLLLDACWTFGGKLPDDDAQLARITRCETREEWLGLRKVLAQFFKISGGFWKHMGQAEQRERATKLHHARSFGGQKTAAKLWKHKIKNNHSSATSSAYSPAVAEHGAKHGAEHGAKHGAEHAVTKNQNKKEKKDPPSGGQKEVALPAVEPAALEGEVLAPNGSTAKGSRLPLDWQPDERDCEYARFRGLDPLTVAESFCDYWRAQPGLAGRKTDWHATWRTWCRKEITYLSRRTLSPDRLSPRTVQTEAFYHAANDIERARNC